MSMFTEKDTAVEPYSDALRSLLELNSDLLTWQEEKKGPLLIP